MTDLFRLGAAELAAALRQGRVSARAAVEACLARIAAKDNALRAFVTLSDEALDEADRADRTSAADRSARPLHGVPVAVKDLTATAGLRTTFGSARFRDFVPEADEYCVARLRAAGAIILGKTNTPEFGFGAVCENAVAGPTRNPWDTTLTSGGSSGGSAVAVASGMAFLAHGTDFGGSVRTPASFCGCVGLRPTPGTIAEPARDLAWNGLATHGVLARSVADAALMLSVMAGPETRDPTSLPRILGPAPAASRPDAGTLRLAVSPDLGGAFRIDADVRGAFAAAVEAAALHFACLSEAAPDCAGAVPAFRTLRAAQSWQRFKPLLAAGTHDLSPSFVWNIEQGRSLSAEDYLAAEVARGRVFRAFADFFAGHDVLMLPSASVLPFPNAQGEVRAIDGVPCETIIDYLAPTFIVSLVGFPAISLPAGRSADGRPFGVQLVARPGEEMLLLDAALQLQERAGFRHAWPPEI